ncbi:MAG: hypothetical protein CMK59_11615 [Proteobacteria bacterium]|nr:hypothetical protein [Pseudomonadota bacterium]
MYLNSDYNMLLFSLFLNGCNTTETPLPAQESAEDYASNNYSSPLYQILYSGHAQPSREQQRVRILLWIQSMNFERTQLLKLDSLHKEVLARQKKIVETEQELLEFFLKQENPIYNKIWDALKAGEDPSSLPDLEQLRNIRNNRSPQKDLLKLRVNSIQSILEAESSFLKDLTPTQEQKMVDALFFLRHKLDPIGTPGDFKALIGSTYEPGQYAVLTRGTSNVSQQNLNIGGLWTDTEQLSGKELHEARREVVLYLLLLEPALNEAIRAELDDNSPVLE